MTKRLALALASASLFPLAAHAVEWGNNCTTSPNCSTFPATVAMLQALQPKGGIYRMRIPVPGLIYSGASYGVGNPATPQSNLDPVAMALAPDTTTCSGVNGYPVGQVSYPIKVNGANNISPGPIVSDFLPSGTSVCAKNGATLSVTRLPSRYVEAAFYLQRVGPGGLASMLQNPTPPYPRIDIELDVFNPANPGSPQADSPVLDSNGAPCATTACDNMHKVRLTYLVAQVASTGALPVVMTVGNEEDGIGGSGKCRSTSYKIKSLADYTAMMSTCAATAGVTATFQGDYGDLGATDADATPTSMTNQIQKMRDVCTVAHQFGIKCSDGGIEASTVQVMYANYLWNDCFTPSQLVCRQEADIFGQWGFSKSIGQDEYAQALLPSCEYPTGGPPYLNGGHLTKALRGDSILTEEARTGPDAPDIVDIHAYELFGQGSLPMWTYFKSFTGKPVMFDEVATYSYSAPDLIKYMNGFVLAGAVYVLWWNGGGSSNNPVPGLLSNLSQPFAGSNPTQVPLSTMGQLWVKYQQGLAPTLVAGNAQPLPILCPPQQGGGGPALN